MEPLIPQAIGWYGKLPSRGDFVGRGLPRSWQRVWDEWLQRALAEAAKALGAAALRERLREMPPWMWVVWPGEGEADQPAWCGVVVASADRVGRVFPLLLGEAHPQDALGRVSMDALEARAQTLIGWLREAAALGSMKEFEKGAARLGAGSWADASAGVDGANLADLRRVWPDAASFWWGIDDDGEMRTGRAEAWPPAAGLLLGMLGERGG